MSENPARMLREIVLGWTSDGVERESGFSAAQWHGFERDDAVPLPEPFAPHTGEILTSGHAVDELAAVDSLVRLIDEALPGLSRVERQALVTDDEAARGVAQNRLHKRFAFEELRVSAYAKVVVLESVEGHERRVLRLSQANWPLIEERYRAGIVEQKLGLIGRHSPVAQRIVSVDVGDVIELPRKGGGTTKYEVIAVIHPTRHEGSALHGNYRNFAGMVVEHRAIAQSRSSRRGGGVEGGAGTPVRAAQSLRRSGGDEPLRRACGAREKGKAEVIASASSRRPIGRATRGEGAPNRPAAGDRGGGGGSADHRRTVGAALGLVADLIASRTQGRRAGLSGRLNVALYRHGTAPSCTSRVDP